MSHFRKHRILRKIGINLDDASNGIFLRERAGGISTMSRHEGYHQQYTNVIRQCLNAMDISKSIPELEKEVYELQQAARRMMEAGVPIYMCDHVPGSNTKIGKKSEKIYGVSGSDRTEQFLRRMLRKYGF